MDNRQKWMKMILLQLLLHEAVFEGRLFKHSHISKLKYPLL